MRYGRLSGLVAAAMTGVLALTACGGGGDAKDDGPASLRMTVWSANEAHLKLFNEIADEYRKNNPDVAEIKFDPLPFENYTTTLTTQIAGGNAPDLAWIFENSAPDFVASGALSPLDDTLKKADGYQYDDLSPATLKLWRNDGKLFAYPFSTSPCGVCVNNDMLNKAGQKTPAELIAAGQWNWDTALAAAGATAAALAYISATKWLLQPSLGPVVILVTGLGIACAVTAVSTGLRNRRALYSALTTAVVGTILWFPLQFLFRSATGGLIAGLAVVTVVVGVVIGYLWGGPDRGQSARTSAIVAFLMGLVIFSDRLMQAWKPYSESSVIGGRPVPTIGSQTPGLTGSYWVVTLDQLTHLLLPTLALILISFAGYTRYQRASMLEVMNQDYVRTARAKGLTERTVIMRHAFRNSLIPLATIVPLDVAALLGGAVITERIFGWSGMGTMFLRSLGNAELDPLMIYVLIVGAVAVFANFVADLVYAALDPRIRVNA